MILISDVSLSQSLHCWELAEYISEAFVILACAGELVADFGEKWLGEKRKKQVERPSTILLVGALSVALICLVRTNELSGNVIGSLGEKAEEADREAQTAIGDSTTALSQAKDALTKATDAKSSLEQAEDEANRAQAASSRALTLAKDARQEADSFEKDIKAAKEQAASAESHLAEALRKATDIEQKLAWRDLTLQQQFEIASAIRGFGPKKYSLIIWGSTLEVTQLAQKVANAVGQGGWILDGWGFAMAGTTAGVVVSTQKGAPSDAADALIKALNAKGIFSVRGPQYEPNFLPAPMSGDWKGDAPIRIGIGYKP